MTLTTSPQTLVGPTADFPYRLERLGVLMEPDPTDPNEAEGVLNPASAVGPDGRLWLFPRVVAAGNRSRIARAEILVTDGVPTSVRRQGIALAPDRGWESGTGHGGVEDPRVTWITDLGRHVMAYVAYGPLGPRAAVAVLDDKDGWRRLGPVQFEYEDSLGVDMTLYPNKDLAFFPDPIAGPDGEPCLGLLHRPMWRISADQADPPLPHGVTDHREGIWLSYVRLADAKSDLRALTRPFGHREIASCRFEWESVKIGGGTPPIRVPEGWLVFYHGVSGIVTTDPFEPQRNVYYAAGGLILDALDPSRVLHRSSTPLLAPETDDERVGMVGNIVFPTAIEKINGVHYVFYGMADKAIGIARVSPA